MKRDFIGTVSIVSIILIVVLIISMIVSVIIPLKAPQNTKSQYFCDAKVFTFALDIDIENMSDEVLYNVRGEFFYVLEDNLKMNDMNNNVVREMQDDYNFITQNDHAITNSNGALYVMDGNFKWFGDSYKIFNSNKEQVATLECNMFMTHCTLKDMQGNILAEYNSRIFRKDYIVSIYDGCEIDDESILMMFASAYSDVRADSSSSSND